MFKLLKMLAILLVIASLAGCVEGAPWGDDGGVTYHVPVSQSGVVYHTRRHRHWRHNNVYHVSTNNNSDNSGAYFVSAKNKKKHGDANYRVEAN